MLTFPLFTLPRLIAPDVKYMDTSAYSNSEADRCLLHSKAAIADVIERRFGIEIVISNRTVAGLQRVR